MNDLWKGVGTVYTVLCAQGHCETDDPIVKVMARAAELLRA